MFSVELRSPLYTAGLDGIYVLRLELPFAPCPQMNLRLSEDGPLWKVVSVTWDHRQRCFTVVLDGLHVTDAARDFYLKRYKAEGWQKEE